jgi:predicted N-acyltransferase
MSLSVQIFNSVAQVGQSAWDELGQRRAFGSYQWYQFGEAVLDDCVPVYISVSENGRPVGRATFWVVRHEPLPDMKSLLWRVVQPGVKAFLRARPLLICRSPLSNTSGLILPETPGRETVLAEIIQAARRAAERYRCSFVVFDQLGQADYEDTSWTSDALKMVFPDPGSIMEMKWQTFDDYLNSLTPKTRKNYRRYARYAEGKNLIIRALTRPDEAQLRAAKQLFLNVERRFDQPPSLWFDKVFRFFPMVGGVLLTAEMDGHMVGCELILKDGDEQFVPAVGLDYSAQNIYFLLGYADIRLTIEQGLRRLHWGMGTFDVKRRMGFEQEYNNYSIYFGMGLLGRVVGRLATFL